MAILAPAMPTDGILSGGMASSAIEGDAGGNVHEGLKVDGVSTGPGV